MNHKKKLLAAYINEFNINFLVEGAKKYNCQSIIKFLKKKKLNTFTKDKIQNKNLDPWVQNVSINTGVPSSEHQVYNIGHYKYKKSTNLGFTCKKKNYLWSLGSNEFNL